MSAKEMHLPRLPVVEVKHHNGRPTLFVDGTPKWRPDNFEKTTPWFCEIGMSIYFVAYSSPSEEHRWGEQLFWRGDEISDEPLWETMYNVDEQIAFILERDPNAYFIVRNGNFHCPSWCDLHPEEMFVDRHGERADYPSMGSTLWFDCVVEHGEKLVQWCERQPWADRLIGHWYGWELEGTPRQSFDHQLFDYSPVMQRYFAKFLQQKYKSSSELCKAWNREGISFDMDLVPPEILFGDMDTVRNSRYWQSSAENQPLRDYINCLADSYHTAFKRVSSAMADASRGQQLFLYDCMKTTMQGWSIFGFFETNYNTPPCYNDGLAASGHMRIGELLSLPELGGIITPHDYQNRGIGGVFEPEGAVDSCVLRGKVSSNPKVR
ncbi:MAG: hypothetical protein ACYTGH_17890 [Planctomycetota bacterium]|jgi:hypothetical protein